VNSPAQGHCFAHVDLDAFYASVEVLDFPHLRGLPVAVGGPARGRGVIAAASYEARRFGVRSAMPTARALSLCPQLVLRAGRMGRYQEKSEQVFHIVRELSPRIEMVSLDEAFLDLRGCERLHAPWTEFSLRLRRRVYRETGLWISIGIGETRRISKIGSALRKPRGVVVVPRGAGREFLAPLPVEFLWGVGAKLGARLHEQGYSTIGDLAASSTSLLRSQFGKMGTSLLEMAQARELGHIDPARAAKSVSHELTFARDLHGEAELLPVLLKFSEKIAYRLRKGNLQGRVVQLKIRDNTFRTLTRRVTLPAPSAHEDEIYRVARKLLRRLNWGATPVRLIGLGMHEITQEQLSQGELFTSEAARIQPQLERTLDRVHTRYGGEAIGRARTLLRRTDNSASWEAVAWEKTSAENPSIQEETGERNDRD
jgi:DNA polymerase-4